MIKRYQGNSGKITLIKEEEDLDRKRQGPEKSRRTQTVQPEKRPGPSASKGGAGFSPPAPGGGLQNILGQLGRLLPGSSGKAAAPDTEDIILLLILYLMYRESGDRELLMLMGAMFLL